MRSKTLFSVAAVALLAVSAAARAETTLTIATVNNPDMVVMQKHSSKFEKATGIKLKWLVLEENVLRQRVTTDISTNGGQFDIITIGMYETPLWGKAKWLVPFDDTPESYDLNDVLPTVRDGLSHEGKLYSLPFYAESTMTFYRTDLFQKAGLKMSDNPTWSQVAEFAAKLSDKANGTYGLCIRGQPGWGPCSPTAVAPCGSTRLSRPGSCSTRSARRSPIRLGSRRRRSRSGTRAMAGCGPGLWGFRPRARV